jgi:Na+/melibiose symporter-like transporter
VEHVVGLLQDISVWISLAILALIFWVIPVGRILRRTGHHPLWCLTFVVPLVGYLGLWFLAFKRWPIDNSDQQESET